MPNDAARHNTTQIWPGSPLCTNISITILYSVSQRNPPRYFLTFFPKRLGIFVQILHAYYAFISTLDYKFLFNYLQL